MSDSQSVAGLNLSSQPFPKGSPIKDSLAKDSSKASSNHDNTFSDLSCKEHVLLMPSLPAMPCWAASIDDLVLIVDYCIVVQRLSLKAYAEIKFKLFLLICCALLY